MALSKTIPARDVQAAIARLAAAIARRHRPSPKAKGGGPSPRIWLLGIANGGVPLAYRLAAAINALPDAMGKAVTAVVARAGALDISFHRDDIGRHPVPKEFTSTLLPCDVTDATVILVDDVLFTGRTVKASLDELFDHGRPARVELAVLVDRGGRRLPVAPDYVGLVLTPSERENVVVTIDNDHPARDAITVAAA